MRHQRKGWRHTEYQRPRFASRQCGPAQLRLKASAAASRSGQCRKVDDLADQVIDLTLEAIVRLAVVDRLHRALADDMDPEQLSGIGVKDQLHQAGDVADDLAPRDLAIARLADLVGNPGL